MSRILTISDIHGHAAGAEELLRMADYVPGRDRLYLLGDFIDGDRRTWGAIGSVRQWVREGARAVLGNMERWLLAEEADSQAAFLSKEDVDFLKETPLYWRDGEYLLVHAGVRPGVPLERQSAADLTGIRQEFWGDGDRLPYTVVFGHTPTFKLGAHRGELWLGRDRIGIDTGAKHGCRLTLVDLGNRLSYSCSTEPETSGEGGADAQTLMLPGDFARYGDYRRAPWPG